MIKNIACFDIEATGLSVKDDYIIQLAASKLDGSTFDIIEDKMWYVKPIHNYMISDGAFETHHLTKEFIESNGIPWPEVADEFLNFINDCDILSYNGNRFDIRILYKDLQLIGKDIDMNRKFYDSYAMECRFIPRDLSTIYKKYTGKDLDNAHDALADVHATIDVFKCQFDTYKLTREEIDSFEENELITPDGSIRNSAKPGEPKNLVFGFGKYKDAEFMSICQMDPSYIDWFMKKIASDYTKQILRQYYKEKKRK